MSKFLRPLFSLRAPAGAAGRLNILIFHRVLAAPDPLFPGEVHASQFDAMLGWLKAWFNVLPLDEAVERLRQGRLPSRAAAISFDDGYADNHDIALPLIQRHGLTATFFIATSYIGGGCMFNDGLIESVRRCRQASLNLESLGLGHHKLESVADRQSAIRALIQASKYRPMEERSGLVESVAACAEVELPKDLMMNVDQVRALRRGGMQIGAHTVGHPILATLDDVAAAQEIRSGRASLEDWLREPVTLFAFPNGRPGKDYRPEQARLVESLGFRAAVSTAWGAADAGTDPFQLPRFTPWDRSELRFGLRLLRNLSDRGPRLPVAA